MAEQHGPALSVAIVCKDSEPTIGRTLESVAPLGGEIVAVDSGSTDGTIGLLGSFGARVVRSQWLGYAATKQKAMEACGGRWVLNLDSDESLDERLRSEIQRVVGGDDGGAAGYRVNRVTWYAGRPLRHAWQPERIVRLVRRGEGRWSGMEPHAAMEVEGRVGDLAGSLRHDSFVSFEEHLGRQYRYARIAARAMLEQGKRGSLARLAFSPAGAFVKQMVLKSAWRDGYAGWLAAASTAAATLMKHAILIELCRNGARRGGAGE